jgi:hypothetical protein
LLVSQTSTSTTMWSSNSRNLKKKQKKTIKWMNWEWSWPALSLHEISTLVNQTSPDIQQKHTLLCYLHQYLFFFIGICISQNPILRRRLSSGSPMNNDVIFHERIVFLHITLFSQCLSKTTKMSPWRSNGKRQKCRFGAERVK